MEKIKSIEISSALLTLLSKIALFFDNVLGWPLAVVGYFLIAIYNFRQKMVILAVTVSGMTFVCAYGWYKWSQGIHGLQTLDYIVIGSTIIFALILYFLNIKNNKVIEHIQALITITALSAWLLIGFKMYLIGWSFMLISHCLLAYVYKQKKANYYVWLQIISIIIAFIKLIEIIFSNN